jgi:hypothetical protein
MEEGLESRRRRWIDGLTSLRIEHYVPKQRKNRIREERIHNEVIVDAYGPEEQALGWYYYLENKIQFPFLGSVHGPPK